MAAELKQTPVISEELKNWVSTAASSGATDMHIEPYGEGLRVRLRVGGALVQPPFQSEAPEGAVDQLKAMAGLPLGKSLSPNSGIFSVDIDEDKMVSVRLTTFPTLRGDRLLLRFTSLEELASFDELGLNTDQIRTLSQTVSRRGGLTIVSGPWCSGKSATLHVIARQLNREELHVVSIEEVIEREIPGVTQTQVDEANGMDFASSLQHAMRHDPDVIVLGDIPDRATAKLVMDACMQGGFRVVAGFNSATVFETVEGLIERGFDRDQLGYILSGVCMQRLVRRICPHCKRPADETRAVRQQVGFALPENAQFYAGAGCEACQKTGYLGRVGVYEVVR
ncbi:MAG: ATPase, T2SS/T4P/T4SS family, partial [Myxococcota bacterium]|nr:ATPase, T2SS/T4P/T4SS family [Myxococcota bacterium]